MLKLRILTALILIPIVVWGIFYLSQTLFMWITAFVTLLAAWEWSRLSGWIAQQKRFLYAGLQGCILLYFMIFPANPWLIKFGLLFWLCLSIYLLWARRKPVLPTIPVWVRAMLGWLILTLCWLALQALQLTPDYLLFMLLIIWLADTGAYIGGRLWGQHLLAPTLSPKKTWEGLVIGLLITFFAAMLIQHFFKGTKPFIGKIFVIVFFTSLATIAGDLFESQLKRLERVKDSGHLLPGHGGILDRIDSLLAAAPVFLGFLLLLGLAS